VHPPQTTSDQKKNKDRVLGHPGGGGGGAGRRKGEVSETPPGFTGAITASEVASLSRKLPNKLQGQLLPEGQESRGE